ncbi:MAG: hypothetical protein ACXADY_16975 [Candidatus Hodarchaeales archaeon]
MLYNPLSKEKTTQVVTTINHVLGSNIMTKVMEKKNLIKIIGHRNDVYMVLREDLPFFDRLSSNLSEQELNIVHARIKLGFFIHEKFLIGIESLSFLAPFVVNKIQLDAHCTLKFIYGNDIDINTILLQKQIKHLEEDTTIMVFSDNNIPLGYAKIFSKKEKLCLQNLVDIGIFLRSEKSAF